MRLPIFGRSAKSFKYHLNFKAEAFDIEMELTTPKRSGDTNRRATLALGVGSVRVAHCPQFLPVKDRDTLFKAACANQELFNPAGGVDSAVGSTLYWSDDSGTEDPILRETTGILRSNILDRLPSIFRVLGVEPFPVSQIPLNLIHGLDGHSGLPHADSIDGRYAISLLYYFHSHPKVFRGGDLELYEADAGSERGHGVQPLARIDNEDNLLLAFKSQTYHGVTDVQCDSAEFADGRFVAVSFLGAP